MEYNSPMLKTIGTTVLVIVAMLSCGTAQASCGAGNALMKPEDRVDCSREAIAQRKAEAAAEAAQREAEASLNEYLQRPEVQEYADSLTKEETFREMTRRTGNFNGHMAAAQEKIQNLINTIQMMEASASFRETQASARKATIQEYTKFIQKLKKANSGFSDTEKSHRRTINDLERRLDAAERNNNFAIQSARQQGYDQGRNSCQGYRQGSGGFLPGVN